MFKYSVASGGNVILAAKPGVIAKTRVGAGEAVLFQIDFVHASESPDCAILLRELLTNIGVRLIREEQQ